jgi:glutamate 5-kinase
VDNTPGMVESELENESRRRLRGAQRVVVKLGTSTVTGEGGGLSAERVAPLVRSMSALREAGRQLVLVSSGAVGLGAGRLGLHRSRLNDLATRQAAAAVGQSLLMHAYEQLFREHDVPIAQVLLTQDDFKDRGRYGNLRRTMERLLKLNVVPVVNENDTVSTDELEYLTGGPERVFGDNDRLAALVMSRLEAGALVLLTNVEGLFRNGPQGGGVGDEAEVVRLVREVTRELKSAAGGASAGGRGGMLTKLEAAEIAMRAGGVAVIANGARPGVLETIFAGEAVGTTFMASSRMAGKRRWIAYAAGVRGRLVVNDGAREALLGGKASLLSSGVVGVEEQFGPQAVVAITDSEGREFARGIVNCASAEARELVAAGAGAQSRVLVTRDNIVLLEE